MLIANYRDLTVWQKAHALVLDIYRHTSKFPNEETFGLTTQVRRSSVSICANLAEGYRKKTLDYARYIQMAQASLQETTYHILLSKDLGYISNETYEGLSERTEIIGKMLSGLHKSILRAK
ncbi:MAG: four helix bundle protein [Candidatus Omnitrophica bacterium]|nr:four helix bundle protein [Candidatus Omnitrophota bacterium]